MYSLPCLQMGLKPLRSRKELANNDRVQGSVRHPNEISSELKNILDKKRRLAKTAINQ